MSCLFWIAIVAAVASAGLILALLPILRRLALAHPNARSSHRVSTPQGAGIAVIAATIGATLVFAAFVHSTPDFAKPDLTSLGIVLSAAAMIAVVGAIDDVRTLEVLPRLLLHALAVSAAVASLPVNLHVLAFLPWWVERALLLLAGLWFVNLTNFMDGIDWMTVAEFLPLTAGLALLGWHGALPIEGTVVAAALCGGLIGFAPFNRPVARIFLGDVGSLPIGLLGGWLLMLLAGRGHLAAALILPLYYFADATLTLLRRIGRGEPFWQAHRTHFYQRATDRGLSVREIVARVFAVNLGLVALATATVLWPGRLLDAAALACAAALVGWLLLSFRRGKS
jgi:UDP-N-acetylmuramyl pentapeptide phosphotransferase/UDP-N-acetylglucosamine-1-phosphate transferase